MTAASLRATPSSRIPLTYVVTIVPLAAALNIVGGTLNTYLKLPTFLDMIGTAVAAIVLGPWWGALVGIIGNLGGALFQGPVEIPFALVNVTGALIWGYGVRSFGMGATVPRFFLLNVIVALVNSVVAAPIVAFVFGGATGHPSDALTAAFAQAGTDLLRATFQSSVIVFLADKIITGFVAVTIIQALPPELSRGLRLPRGEGASPLALGLLGTTIGIVIVVAYILVAPPTPPA
jgi:ABC-type Co2+ transport system permease subunit